MRIDKEILSMLPKYGCIHRYFHARPITKDEEKFVLEDVKFLLNFLSVRKNASYKLLDEYVMCPCGNPMHKINEDKLKAWINRTYC